MLRNGIIIFTFIAIVIALLFNGSITPEKMRQQTLVVNSVPVSADIAVTNAQKQKGLSGRTALGLYEGLLLVGNHDGMHGIWMPDMHFPIDVLWLDTDGTIVHIQETIPPESYPEVFASPVPARHVLELPAGFIRKHGIAVGDIVSGLPVF